MKSEQAEMRRHGSRLPCSRGGKTRRWLPALALGICLLGRTASADGEFGRTGGYLAVGGSFGLNVLERFLDNDPVLSQLRVDNSWGVNARAGYRLASWFALEGEYEWLGRNKVEFASARVGSVGLQSATANLRFIAPGRVQPYLLLGAGILFVSVDSPFNALSIDSTAFAGRVGVGLDVYLTRNLLVNAGVESVLSPARVTLNAPFPEASERGLGTVNFQVGLGYRF